MHTPLEIAVCISHVVSNAQADGAGLDLASQADALYTHFRSTGYSREDIAATLRDEAVAAGVVVH
ncbi:hypothetical protein ACUN0C_05120 [Faunimonas sp. B44]|uniref:hypothetical protein n=1 Tax=Faunimonas sp. B44 TaxID=3461493 RepID=UPI0040440F32